MMTPYYHSKYVNSSLKRKKKSRSRGYRIVRFILVVGLVIGGYFAWYVYTAMYQPNIWTANGKPISFYVYPNESYASVETKLYQKGLIINRKKFEWLSEKMKYPENVKVGHYRIPNGMNNNDLINMLRSGSQAPVNVIFNNTRTIEDFAVRISEQLLLDTASLLKVLSNSAFLEPMGFTPDHVKIMFIPNTYEFYWTVSAEAFVKRMNHEYKRFWTDDKKQLAQKAGLTPEEVSILASIVEMETAKNDEKTRIAGVYINRLKRGWRLQADPTLIYALRDFSINRVLDKHKRVDSPYNTYKYKGLPPGPICMPSISSINAVLNYEKHQFMFFCAKADFSGYHAFARTSREHINNANEYQKALNKKRIWE